MDHRTELIREARAEVGLRAPGMFRPVRPRAARSAPAAPEEPRHPLATIADASAVPRRSPRSGSLGLRTRRSVPTSGTRPLTGRIGVPRRRALLSRERRRRPSELARARPTPDRSRRGRCGIGPRTHSRACSTRGSGRIPRIRGEQSSRLGGWLRPDSATTGSVGGRADRLGRHGRMSPCGACPPRCCTPSHAIRPADAG
jgi:hypothetical protein